MKTNFLAIILSGDFRAIFEGHDCYARKRGVHERFRDNSRVVFIDQFFMAFQLFCRLFQHIFRLNGFFLDNDYIVIQVVLISFQQELEIGSPI